MFKKTGSPQPIDVVYTCCLCDMAASKIINGKNYCDKHAPDVALIDTNIIIQPEPLNVPDE